MEAREAMERQIAAYRRMSAEERLGIALRLHEMACEITREGIRRQHPQAPDGEIERLLHDRLRLLR